MKIAITGHSRGLGKEFFDSYSKDNHSVIGFSRSSGYDLRDWNQMKSMIAQVEDCDLFISCAKPDFVQTTILYELWSKWKGKDKMILNISSILTYMPTCPPALFGQVGVDAYRTSKVSLNEACAQLSFKSHLPNVVLVKPSHLYDAVPTPEQIEKLSSWVAMVREIIDNARDRGFKLYEITI